MLGIKQEALAFDLGDDWNQKKISMLEQKEQIEDPLLQQISEVLRIPVEAFKNFDEEKAINVISNITFENCPQPSVVQYNPNFHPVEKIMELHDEKIALYERMLREKDDMMEKLQQLIQK